MPPDVFGCGSRCLRVIASPRAVEFASNGVGKHWADHVTGDDPVCGQPAIGHGGQPPHIRRSTLTTARTVAGAKGAPPVARAGAEWEDRQRKLEFAHRGDRRAVDAAEAVAAGERARGSVKGSMGSGHAGPGQMRCPCHLVGAGKPRTRPGSARVQSASAVPSYARVARTLAAGREAAGLAGATWARRRCDQVRTGYRRREVDLRERRHPHFSEDGMLRLEQRLDLGQGDGFGR